MVQFRPASFCLLTVTTLLSLALLLSGCGDPAPGEGVENPLMHEPMPAIADMEDALQTPVILTVDLGTMHRADIERVLGAGPYCFFAYTAESPPVLALTNRDTETGRGVIKIHGKLVELSDEEARDYQALSERAVLTTEGARVEIMLAERGENEPLQPGQQQVADAVFALDQGLHVGYRGWYSCRGQAE